jgi:uncharacterized protein (TIGR02646 family)
MKAIEKTHGPQDLTTYREKPGAEYDGPEFTPVKNALRKSILNEQGYICAYCMSRVYDDANTSKVEHWHSRAENKYPKEQLDYQNLLVVCLGNKGEKIINQHCDELKKDRDLRFNPSNKLHHSKLKIRYTFTGEIVSDDPVFKKELVDVLNLNIKKLKDNRKAIRDLIIEALGRESGTRTNSEISKFIQKWNRRSSGNMLPEYCDVACYYLENKFTKRSNRS